MQPKIVIVIPAYNEEKTIGAVLRGLKAYDQIIVVNDGSSDSTAQIADEAGALVVNHNPNQGYDGAICSGLLKAIEIGADVAVTIDADGQHNPENIDALLNEMQSSDAACVIGQRPKLARISEHIFCLYTRLRYGIADCLSGLKAYRIKALKHHTQALNIKTAGAAAALAIAKSGEVVKEVQISLKPRADQARIGGALRANVYIFKAMARTIKMIGL